MSFDFSTLVFDRIQADVEALNDKGTYNAADLNRVTAAMEELDGIFKDLGYQTGYQPVQTHPLPLAPDTGGGGGDDPHTLLLIHGPDIADSSVYGRELTNVGTGQAKVAGSLNNYVLNFNGACRIDLPLGNYFAFGDGDFTIEWREYITTDQSSGTATAGGDPFVFDTDPTPFLFFYVGSNIGLYCTASYMNTIVATTVKNQWVHRALVRNGNMLLYFQNGILVWSGAFSGSATYTPGFVMSVGGRSDIAQYFNGYMEEFRVSDVARWTADFTPPDRPYGAGDVVNITPVMTGPDSPDGYEVSASSVFDQRTSWWAFTPAQSEWHSGAGLPQWLQLRFPEPVEVSEFTIENPQADGYGVQGITTFSLQGSPDGISFETLGEYENDPAEGRIIRFTVPEPAKYLYYRLQITGTGYLYSGTPYCVIAGVQFFQPRGAYTQLAYIESSGTQYIDTGFSNNQNTRIALKAQAADMSTTCWLFGGRISNTSATMGLFWYTNTSAWTADYNGNTQRSQFPGVGQTDPLSVDFDKNTLNINGITKTFTPEQFQSIYPIALFAVNTAGTISGYIQAKLYACQIYDNGELIRSFVPCRREADGAVGLYDQANGIFYANAGTGGFAAGPAVGDAVPEDPDPEPVLDPYTWYESDIPNRTQMEQYLANVERMGAALAGQANMSGLPDSMEYLTWQEANAIEQLLYELQTIIQIMRQTFVACGPATCGGDYL